MKFKALARSEKKCTRELSSDVRARPRNTAPELHPFARAREYKRALNAVKLDRVFAKPLVGALDGHGDGVWCSAVPRSSLVQFLSGACDGEIRLWDLATRKTVWKTPAHRGIVKGVSIAPYMAEHFVSVGDDSKAKLWSLSLDNLRNADGSDDVPKPLATFTGTSAFNGVDHHWTRDHFATASDVVQIWDHNSSDPIQSFKWGSSTTLSVRFNPAEANLLASTGRDRSLGLYDLRAGTPLRKVVLASYCNAMAWNPREPYHLVAACEDSNLYSFDTRHLAKPTMIHKDHVDAVLAVGFSPTGKEFVSGGQDRMLRIFENTQPRSREVYHTRRMGRIWCVNFSQDSKFVLSGSDDHQLRIWKAQASDNLGKQHARREQRLEYTAALKKRFENMPEIRRIAKHRQVPKVIKKIQATRAMQRGSERRKEGNRRQHSKPNSTQHKKPERMRAVIGELE